MKGGGVAFPLNLFARTHELTTEHKTEAILLQQVGEGNQDAFRAFYAGYQRRLFGYFVKIIQDERRAEELVNDVLFVVWKDARKYDATRAGPSTWVFAIAHHKAIDELRRHKPKVVEEDTVAQLADPSPGVEEDLEKADLSRMLKQALEHLSTEHREVVELTYDQEFSIAQIAEVLGIPEGTVKTRMFHARKRLKTLMQALKEGRPIT